jgi:outer membrane protein OmpA-like peptidoglycan-associated protein
MKRICPLIIYTILLQIQLVAQSFDKVVISNLSVINSKNLDFSPVFHKDGLVFVSNQEVSGKEKIFDKRINQPAMSLFLAKQIQKGDFQKPIPFAPDLVTTVHEGPLAFTKDFKTLFFSRNNNTNGKPKYVDFVDHIQIYESQQTEQGWTKAKPLDFNRDTEDYCHPTVSSDGSKLYFSSNRGGGFGGMDLYVSLKQANGKWGAPINLGSSINSNKNEVFPYIHEDGTLYYSSNKEGGIGGLDIYYAQLKNDVFATPLSIGTPLNSENDDFGFIIDKDKKSGYFTSNRTGGVGFDDIYNFVFEEAPQAIQVIVLDKKTMQVIPNATLSMSMNGDANSMQKLYTDANGKSILLLKTANDYDISAEKTNYISQNIQIAQNDKRTEITILLDQPEPQPRPIVLTVLDAKTRLPLSNAAVAWGSSNIATNSEGKATISLIRDNDYTFDISKISYNGEKVVFSKNDTRDEIEVLLSSNIPEPAPKPVVVVTKPTEPVISEEVFRIRNIYYDFGKDLIRADARNTLDELITQLNKYPEIEILLTAHTDSRGSSAFNDDLAKRRAINVEKYLLQNGIAKSRIQYQSSGKNKLVNNCGDGVPCDETAHQSNRRTEITVLRKGANSPKIIEESKN